MRTITRFAAVLAMSVVLLLGANGGASANHGAPHSHYECTTTPGAYVETRWYGSVFNRYSVTSCSVQTNDTAYFPVSAGESGQSSWTVGVARSTYTVTDSQGSFAQSTTYGDVVSCTNPAGNEVGGKAMQKNPHCQHPFG